MGADDAKLHLFGAPRLQRGDRVVHVDRRKGIALLAYLSVDGHAHTRDRMCDIFWPELPQDDARRGLRTALAGIRKVVPPDTIQTIGDTVECRVGEEFTVDVCDFHDALGSICRGVLQGTANPMPEDLEGLVTAADTYTDEFMAGFYLSGCERFDEWQFQTSAVLQRELRDVLWVLCKHGPECAGSHVGVAACRRLVSIDPTDEEAERGLIRLLYQSGDRTGAILQYEHFVQVLRNELNDQPDAETVRLSKEIRSSRVGRMGAPIRSISPAQPFVGRATELQVLDGCLGSLAGGRGRAVSISGPGGIGKTRLIREFFDTVPRDRFAAARARVTEGEEGTLFDAWAQLVDELLCDETLKSVQGTLPDQVLLALNELQTAPDPSNAASPEKRRWNWHTVASVILRLCSAKPLILCIDNAQWADSPSLRVLTYLSELVHKHALLLLVSYRPAEIERRRILQESVVELAKSPDHLELNLTPLGEPDVRRFTESVMAVDTPADQISAAALDLFVRSEGHPLFLVELSQQAMTHDGRMDLSGELPKTLQAAVDLRLARLDSLGRGLIQSAAVIGRSFEIDLLAAVNEIDVATVSGYLPWFRVETLADPTDATGLSYQFRHAIIQERVLETMPVGRRRSLHSRLADLLEGPSLADPHADLTELVRHMVEAIPLADADRIPSIALQAAERASHAAAPERAVDVLTLAVDGLERTPQSRTLVEHRARLIHRLAVMANDAYLPRQASAALGKSFDLFENLGMIDEMVKVVATPLSGFMSGGAASILHAAHMGHASDLQMTMWDRVRPLVEPGTLNEGYLILTSADRTLKDVSRALEIAEAYGDSALETQALSLIATSTLPANRDRADRAMERLWTKWPTIRDDLSCFRAVYWSHVRAVRCGDLKAVQKYQGWAQILANTTGESVHHSSALRKRAFIRGMTGRLSDARELASQTAEMFEAHRDTWGYSHAITLSVDTCLLMDEMVPARQHLLTLHGLAHPPDMQWASRAVLFGRYAMDHTLEEEARGVIATTAALEERWYFIEQLLLASQVFLASMHRDVALAGELLSNWSFDEEELTRPPGPPLSHPHQLHALVLDVAGQHEAASRRFTSAEQWCRDAGFVNILALVLLDHAQSLVRTHGRANDQANELLAEAETIATKNGIVAANKQVKMLRDGDTRLALAD